MSTEILIFRFSTLKFWNDSENCGTGSEEYGTGSDDSGF
jgi:hypothetical protein